jgi:hypothetical protein
MDIRNGSHAFDEVDEIYLDDIIEIDKFPENPVLMRYGSQGSDYPVGQPH